MMGVVVDDLRKAYGNLRNFSEREQLTIIKARIALLAFLMAPLPCFCRKRPANFNDGMCLRCRNLRYSN